MSSLAVQSSLLGGNVTKRMQQGIFQGPGNNLKTFFRWANTHLTDGMPTSSISADNISDYSAIEENIPLGSFHPDSAVSVVNAIITQPDDVIWTEKYLSDHFPELLDLEWFVDHDDTLGHITVSFPENDTPDIIFTPSNWDKTKDYLVARYTVVEPGAEGPSVGRGTYGPYSSMEGTQTDSYEASPDGNIPDIPGTQVFTLVRREVHRVEYKDLRPATETEDITTSDYINVPYSREYNWKELLGYPEGSDIKRLDYINHTKTVNVRKRRVTNVTRSTVEYADRIEILTVYNDATQDEITYTYSTRSGYNYIQSEDMVYIYELGSGNAALDIFTTSSDFGTTEREFFPMLPMRLDNRFIDREPHKTNIYDDVAKAYKKAFGSKIDDILESLKDNDSIGDIDFAYLVFGVTLNERDSAGKRYIYEFLKGLMDQQTTTKAEYDGYIAQSRASSLLDMLAQQLLAANKKRIAVASSNRDAEELPPPPPRYPSPKRNTVNLNVRMKGTSDYRMSFSWTYVHETINIGLGKEGAKRGDIWWDTATDARNPANMAIGLLFKSRVQETNTKRLYLYYQHADLSYKRLEVVGLTHSNYVYAGKYVNSEAYDVVKSGHDDESPFFLPLHMPTFNRLSPLVQNQLGYCSRLMVFNCYVKQKVKWYQRGIFKVVLAIAMIVISVVLPGTGIAMAPGLLGTNVAVGTALGLAGTAAVIAGAVANMLVAMILTTFIQKASVAIFGEAFGNLIGSIVSMMALQVGTNWGSTGSISMNWSNFFSPRNLIKMSESVATSVTIGFGQKINDLIQDYEKDFDQYKDDLKDVQDKLYEEFGNSAWIDPMLMTEAVYGDELALRESRGTFLNRTLLTGMDIAEITMSSITGFADLSLKLPEAIT